MFERTATRFLPLANRAADQAPMVTACCNACRTCVQANIIGLALAGAAGLRVCLVRIAQRLAK